MIDVTPSPTTEIRPDPAALDADKASGATVDFRADPYIAAEVTDSSARDVVVSADLVDGRLEVVRRVLSPDRNIPDTVWREIYEAEDGVIRLTRMISGRHVPAHTEPERVEFET